MSDVVSRVLELHATGCACRKIARLLSIEFPNLNYHKVTRIICDSGAYPNSASATTLPELAGFISAGDASDILGCSLSSIASLSKHLPTPRRTRRERQQVFRGNRLRTDSEQIGWLRERADYERMKASSGNVGEVTVDRDRKGILHGGRFFSVSELAGFVATLSQ